MGRYELAWKSFNGCKKGDMNEKNEKIKWILEYCVLHDIISLKEYKTHIRTKKLKKILNEFPNESGGEINMKINTDEYWFVDVRKLKLDRILNEDKS